LYELLTTVVAEVRLIVTSSVSHGHQFDAIVMRAAVTGSLFILDACIQKFDSLDKQSSDRFRYPYINH
jgi:hypothetical protein